MPKAKTVKKFEIEDLMENPPPKKILWSKWSASLSEEEKEVIRIMRNEFTKEMERNGFIIRIYVQPVAQGEMIWADQGIDLLYDEFDDASDRTFIIFELILDKDSQTFRPFLENGIYLQNNVATKEDKAKLTELFKTYFPNYYNWNGSRKRAIQLKLAQ